MKENYKLQATSYNRDNHHIISSSHHLIISFLLSAFCFLHSALFAQQSGITTLDLLNPTNPSTFVYTAGGYWDKTFNDVDYKFFKSQIFSFSHLIEGPGSSFGNLAWNGFTVCNSGDNTNHTGQNWNDYQWGCMAGGGIMTDAQGNVMTDENGEVMVQKGLPYLVGYWSYTMEPEWWHLYWFQGIFLDEPTHCLQILLDDDEEYEAVGVYINIHPWAYYANLFGDGFARPLNQEGDFIKLFIHGLNADGTESGKSVEYIMAKFENAQLIQSSQWVWIDLSLLGEIGGFYCTMETTDVNSMGPKSPMYFCMDKLQVRKKGTVPHISVSDIINLPSAAAVGTPLTLTGTVIPTDATFQTIIWSIKDEGNTGATIEDNILNTTANGTAQLTATIIDGVNFGENFVKDFFITVDDDITTYVITATVNNSDFGTINPTGNVHVEEGGSVTFFITAFENYAVSDVLVNDISQGDIYSYTFDNVRADGTIAVVFDEVGVGEIELSKIHVYSHQNSIFIKILETQFIASLKTVEIFDMTGRLVYQGAVNNNETVITLHVPNGFYNVILRGIDAACHVYTRVLIVNN